MPKMNGVDMTDVEDAIAVHAALVATHGVAGTIAGQADIEAHAALVATHGVAGTIAGQADIEAHAAVLNAHTQHFHQVLRTGAYWGPTPGYSTGGALSADYLYATLLIVPRDITIDRIAIRVTTAAAAGKKARLGLYNNGTNLYPGALLLDAGEVAIDSTGVKEISISQSLSKGIYWVAITANAAVEVVAMTPQIPQVNPLGSISDDMTASYMRWEKDRSYQALPDPFAAGGWLNAWGSPYLIVRVASLD